MRYSSETYFNSESMLTDSSK